jgi:hypothetical protein
MTTHIEPRAAARLIVGSARRGKTIRTADAARIEGAPSMSSVLAKLMVKVWAIRASPTSLVDVWLARDDLISAWCATFAQPDCRFCPACGMIAHAHASLR